MHKAKEIFEVFMGILERVIRAVLKPLTLISAVLLGHSIGLFDYAVKLVAEQRVDVLISAAVMGISFWLGFRIVMAVVPQRRAVHSDSHMGTAQLTSPSHLSLRSQYSNTAVELAIAHSEEDASTKEIEKLAREFQSQQAVRKPIQAAHHEAAHAVIAHALGSTVTSAWIDPQNNNGQVISITPLDSSPQDHAWISLVTGVAGNVDDHLRGYRHIGAGADMHSCLSNIVSIISLGLKPTDYNGELTVDGLTHGAREAATGILTQYPKALDELASALLEKNSLDGREVRRILEGSITK